MKNQSRFYKLILGVALIAELVCFAPDTKAQTTYSIYRLDTTYMAFRNDTLKIVDTQYSMLSTEGRLILINLDFFGLAYWDILQKHKIKFDSYLQNQLKKIFDKERQGAKSN